MSFYAVYPPTGGGSSSNPSTGTNGQPAPTSSTEVGGINPSGNLQPLQTDATGDLLVKQALDTTSTGTITTQDLATTTSTGANGQVSVLGTPTPGSFVTVALPSVQTAAIELTGTWTGTVQIETSIDNGVTYVAHSIHQYGSPLFISAFTANVSGSLNAGGKTQVRLRATAAMTGTVNARVDLSINMTNIYVANPIKLVDGSSSTSTIQGTIKAGSVLPLATDTALVTTIRDSVTVGSSTLPTGAATSANQTTEIASLQDIDTYIQSINSKTPALGPALSAASTPVVLPATQITALTPPTTVTVIQPTGTNLHTVIDSGSVSVSNFPATQPVSSTQLPAALGQQAAATSFSVALANEDVQDLYMTGAAAQSAVVNNILGSTSGAAASDLTGYRSGSIQVVSTATGGTYIVEGSNDNVNFQTLPIFNQNVISGIAIVAAITPAASSLIYSFPVPVRYVRVRISATLTGGSIQVFSKFSQASWVPFSQQVSQATAANLSVTATVSSIAAGTNNIGVVGTAGSIGISNAQSTTTYTTGAPVTTTAYTQLVASTTSATNYLDIFDSSGQAFILATGASGSEVALAYVPPGGDQIRVQIPAGTRIAIKALTANMTSGYNLFNFWK